MKKKLLALFLTLVCLLCACTFAVGCGDDQPADTETNQSQTTDDNTQPEQTQTDNSGNETAQNEEQNAALTALKANATATLDNSITALLDQIPDNLLRAEINTFLQQKKTAISSITVLDGANATIEQIKSDTADFIVDMIARQLVKLKTAAIARLDEIVATGLDKLNDDELKAELNDFYTTEKAKINAVTDIAQIPNVSAEVFDDTTDFVKRIVASEIAELRATVKGYFNEVNQAFSASPYDYLPETMRPGYAANLVTQEQVEYDFSDFINVNNIKYGGFGKQWNMVIDNITQSEYFYKYLNTGNTIITSAITTVTAYLDSEYADTIDKSFESDYFNADISFANQKFTYSLEYNSGISLPLFGTVSPQITMQLNIVTGEKDFTISLTDTNRMRFSVSDNKYEFGIEYGISAGQRTSYLIIERKNNSVEGHIYEYITLKGKDVMPSCADFYIKDGYVSVVGNKADAMMIAKGYINELYKANEGKLLGYEVRETITSVDYNTLWFNLNDISGITNIKIGDKTNANESGKSTNDVYLNDSDTLFAPTYNKKLGVKTSRKYDIEFRTQYFYSKDAVTGEITEHEAKVPMMFIQEDNDKDTNFTDYPANILADNGITSAVTLNTTYLNKILDDYDTLIDDFIENKQMMGSEVIKAYIES